MKEIDYGTVRVTLTEQCVKKKHIAKLVVVFKRSNNSLFVLYIFSGLCSKVTSASIVVIGAHCFKCKLLHNIGLGAVHKLCDAVRGRALSFVLSQGIMLIVYVSKIQLWRGMLKAKHVNPRA